MKIENTVKLSRGKNRTDNTILQKKQQRNKQIRQWDQPLTTYRSVKFRVEGWSVGEEVNASIDPMRNLLVDHVDWIVGVLVFPW